MKVIGRRGDRRAERSSTGKGPSNWNAAGSVAAEEVVLGRVSFAREARVGDLLVVEGINAERLLDQVTKLTLMPSRRSRR